MAWINFNNNCVLKKREKKQHRESGIQKHEIAFSFAVSVQVPS